MLSSRSYTSRNLSTPVKDSKCKSDCQTASCSSNLNDSFEEKHNSDKYSDNDFELNLDNYLKTMNSFYIQKKELEDFNHATESKVREMRNYYFNKRDTFKKMHNKIKTNILLNYKKDVDYDLENNKKEKIKEMEDKLNERYKSFLKKTYTQEIKAITSYRAKRKIEYDKLLKSQKRIF